MLAAVFGAERFQTYVYGRSFTIKSDHKPLESISQKNLADIPAHLQHMILHLQGYDYNTVKVASLLKEMFLEHRIPEVLCCNNSPQYASAQFTEFCTTWGITHETSSPYYLQLNGFAGACVKSIKYALQCAKHSGADPQLVLLALQAIPIHAKLPSPAELLY